ATCAWSSGTIRGTSAGTHRWIARSASVMLVPRLKIRDWRLEVGDWRLEIDVASHLSSLISNLCSQACERAHCPTNPKQCRGDYNNLLSPRQLIGVERLGWGTAPPNHPPKSL